MQKLELRNHLRDIKNKLSTEYFLEFFTLESIAGNNFKQPFFRALMSSKSAFDQLILDSIKKEIFTFFNNSNIYEDNRYSSLMSFVNSKNIKPKEYLSSSVAVRDFYNFHKSIMDTYNLINDLLFQDSDLKKSIQADSFKEAESKGYLTFEIMSDELIPFNDFSLILSNINTLIKSITVFFNRIEDKNIEEATLLLADSGSKINISVKLPEAIAKSISRIMDEGWLWITNGVAYRLNKVDKSLEKSLSITTKIDDAVKKGIFTEKEAKSLKNEIAVTTEIILSKNTLIKSKAEVINKIHYSFNEVSLHKEDIELKENQPPKELGEGEEDTKNE